VAGTMTSLSRTDNCVGRCRGATIHRIRIDKARPRRVRPVLLAIAIGAALAAGACTSSEREATSSPGAPAAESSTSAEESTEAPTTTSLASSEPPPLGDSFRGVTADAISVGVPFIDFALLEELGFEQPDYGDGPATMQALVDELNDQGGVLGRQVELHMPLYNVANAVDAEAVCVEMMEDVGVFAVLGGFFAPVDTVNTCITDTYEAVLLSQPASGPMSRSAPAPWIQLLPSYERQDQALVDLAHAEGLLADQVVAVYGLAGTEERVAATADHLRELGVVVPLEYADIDPGDPTEDSALWAVRAEQMAEAGVTAAVVVGSASWPIDQIIDTGLAVQVLTSDPLLNLQGTFGRHDDEAYRGIIGLAGPTYDEMWADEAIKDCIEAVERRLDLEILPPDEVPEGEPNWAIGVIGNCRMLALFEAVAKAAGPELTNDSFRGAVHGMGEFALPGSTAGLPDGEVAVASLGPDKYDAENVRRLGVFDPDIGANGDIAPLTDLAPIG